MAAPKPDTNYILSHPECGDARCLLHLIIPQSAAEEVIRIIDGDWLDGTVAVGGNIMLLISPLFSDPDKVRAYIVELLDEFFAEPIDEIWQNALGEDDGE